jgi:hypothetical protein
MGMQVWKPGVNDSMFSFFWHTVKTKTEMAPLFASIAFAGGLVAYFSIFTFTKADIWLNRANKTPPWHWSRAKHLYNKKQFVYFDSPKNWPQIPENEDLQEKMQAASIARHGKSYDYLF